jgi:hypothetical protein
MIFLLLFILVRPKKKFIFFFFFVRYRMGLAEELAAIQGGRYCCTGCLQTAPGGKCTGLPMHGCSRVKDTPGGLNLFLCNNCYKKNTYMDKNVQDLLKPEDFNSFRVKPSPDVAEYIEFLEKRLRVERNKGLQLDEPPNDFDWTDAQFFRAAYQPDPPSVAPQEEEDLEDGNVYLQVFLRDIRNDNHKKCQESTRRLQSHSPYAWRLLCHRKKNAIKIFSLLRWNAELKEAYDIHCTSLDLARKGGDLERVNPPEPKYLPLPDFVQTIVQSTM